MKHDKELVLHPTQCEHGVKVALNVCSLDEM